MRRSGPLWGAVRSLVKSALPPRQHGFADVAFPAIVGDFVNTMRLRRDPSKHHLLAAPMTPQAFKRRHGIGCEWHNTPPRVSTGPYGAARLRITSHSSSEAEQTTCDPSRCPNRAQKAARTARMFSESGNSGIRLRKNLSSIGVITSTGKPTASLPL